MSVIDDRLRRAFGMCQFRDGTSRTQSSQTLTPRGAAPVHISNVGNRRPRAEPQTGFRLSRVSTVKKSHATMPGAWARRNSIQVGPFRRGAGDGADRGGRDVQAELGAFALDALVSPAGVFSGQTQHRVEDFRVKPSPFLAVVWVGPVSGDEVAMPAHQRGWGDHEDRRTVSGQQPGEGGEQGPVHGV
jgi:hypothetical protein